MNGDIICGLRTIVQTTTPAVLTPATCERLEHTFQQLSQPHHAAVREDVCRFDPEVKMENGHSSVGSDFQSDSSMSESWGSRCKPEAQPRVVEYVVTSAGVAVANNSAAPTPPRKVANRPTGPRRPRPQVVVSTMYSNDPSLSCMCGFVYVFGSGQITELGPNSRDAYETETRPRHSVLGPRRDQDQDLPAIP